MTCLVAQYACSPATSAPAGAADCSRAAVLTTSPVTIPSPSSGRASSATTASPALTAARASSPRSRIAARIARPDRTARSASSSCATGAPKTAITASPTNFSIVPPNRSTSAFARPWYAVSRARTSSGSAASDAAVKPTRSTNSTETTFRSSRRDGSAPSGSAQTMQNRARSGFSSAQRGQIRVIARSLGGGIRRAKAAATARTCLRARAPAPRDDRAPRACARERPMHARLHEEPPGCGSVPPPSGNAAPRARAAPRRRRRAAPPAGARREPRSVPDLDVAVQRVALHGRLAERPDQVDELLRRRAVGRAGGRDDVLLDHHGPHVVRAEAERHLADLQALRHPRRLDVRHVVEVDARDSLREQVVERGRHRLARHLRAEPVPVVLERPRDERAKAAGLVLELPDPAHVLDALLERLDVPVHHRGGCGHAEAVRGAHDVEPLLRSRLLRRDLVAHAIDEDLGAAARERVEARVAEPRERLVDRQLGAPRDVLHLARRERVQVDRVARLDRAEEVFVVRDVEVRVVAALHEQPGAADRERLLDLLEDDRLGQQVALARVARAAVEGAEVAVRVADVRVVEVSVDDERDPRRVALAVADLVGDAADGHEVAAAEELECVLVGDAVTRASLLQRDHATLTPLTKRNWGTSSSSPASRA